jgi:hypothetical protein
MVSDKDRDYSLHRLNDGVKPESPEEPMKRDSRYMKTNVL